MTRCRELILRVGEMIVECERVSEGHDAWT